MQVQQITHVRVQFKKGREVVRTGKATIENAFALMAKCNPCMTEQQTRKLMTDQSALQCGESVRINVPDTLNGKQNDGEITHVLLQGYHPTQEAIKE